MLPRFFEETEIIGNRAMQGIVFNNSGIPINILSDRFAPKINLKQSYSIQILLTPKTSQTKWAHIIGNHGGPFSGFVMQQYNDITNQYNFTYGDGTKWNNSKNFQLIPDTVNYVVVTVNSNVIKIYSNGNLLIEEKFDGNFKNSNAHLGIGNWEGGNREFNGEILEFSISDKILNDKQITETWQQIQNRVK